VTITAARAASTVVLLRRATPVEVFLVRRHHEIAFMGGAHVFPGGRVEQSDVVDEPELICDGIDAAARRISDVSAAAAVAFHIAAIRELFEEAGILLARRDGVIIPIDGALSTRFAQYRNALAAGEISMVDVAEREGLRLALDALAYFAHWITPEIEARRFDTRFFAAVTPDTQIATHDAAEVMDGEWITPDAAIARCRVGEIALPPPTWTTLRAVARYRSVDDVMEWARTCTVPRVQPSVIQRGDTRIILLPGDPACAAVAGFEAAERRFTLEGGRWRPIDPE
jgi:8-oxo-dGTP pyrophosphatase MutT (NUDIX family)